MVLGDLSGLGSGSEAGVLVSGWRGGVARAGSPELGDSRPLRGGLARRPLPICLSLCLKPGEIDAVLQLKPAASIR